MTFFSNWLPLTSINGHYIFDGHHEGATDWKRWKSMEQSFIWKKNYIQSYVLEEVKQWK